MTFTPSRRDLRPWKPATHSTNLKAHQLRRPRDAATEGDVSHGRRTLDALLTTGGLALAAILLIAGGAADLGLQVRQQPGPRPAGRPADLLPAGAATRSPNRDRPYLNQYAGQQLTTGAQAEAYADHFIAVHLQGVAGGKTYAQLSAAAMANPTNAKLAGPGSTLFKGETLRGMLLNAYAFWKLGQLALYGAIAAFVGAGIMLLLTPARLRPPAQDRPRGRGPDRTGPPTRRRHRLTAPTARHRRHPFDVATGPPPHPGGGPVLFRPKRTRRAADPPLPDRPRSPLRRLRRTQPGRVPLRVPTRGRATLHRRYGHPAPADAEADRARRSRSSCPGPRRPFPGTARR